jgi:hypothetical protein
MTAISGLWKRRNARSRFQRPGEFRPVDDAEEEEKNQCQSAGTADGGNRNASTRECHVTTLKEFEDALREQGMHMALAILERMRQRDRAKRSIAPARRITGHKMTPELAKRILELHRTTGMTQQEIAFELGVNQGRVNEVIKRGKWLTENPDSAEAVARDRALARARHGIGTKARAGRKPRAERRRGDQRQLALADF